MRYLGTVQEEFSIAEARLTIYAYDNGYRVRKKHLKRCDDCKVGKPNSVHKDSIACDWVLTKNGVVVTADEDYHFLHDKWDKLGGAPRINGDLGHFSFEHNGMW